METRRQWESLCKRPRPSSIRAVKTGVSVEWLRSTAVKKPCTIYNNAVVHINRWYQCLTRIVYAVL